MICDHAYGTQHVVTQMPTKKQSDSGLGLKAQRSAVENFLNGGSWELMEEYLEIESGKKTNRAELNKALQHAKVTRSTLVIAKLDRLSRNAEFLLRLQRKGVGFVAADMPQANTLTIDLMALVAQQEREAISKRTKEALAAAKSRGVKLGSSHGAIHMRVWETTVRFAKLKEKHKCMLKMCFLSFRTSNRKVSPLPEGTER